MKNHLFSILLLACFLVSSPLFAKIDVNQIVGAVASSSDANSQKDGKKSNNSPFAALENELLKRVDGIVEKIDVRVDKVTGKIEERVEKYEKKIDEYESKLESAEKAADKVLNAVNGFSYEKIAPYVKLAKYAAIGIAVIFILSFVLLIVIFMQMIRLSCTVNKLKKSLEK